MAVPTTKTTSKVNVNTPPQNEGYLKKFTSKLGTVFGNRNIQILSGGSLLGSYLGHIGGGAAIDKLVYIACAKNIGGVTGKAVATIVAPALTNYLGKTVILLGGTSGAVTILTLYFSASSVYYIVKNTASKLSDPESSQLSGKDANSSIELNSSREEETEIGEFTILEKV